MKIGFNIAMVCMVSTICITIVTCVGLASGHDGTLMALSFTALGAIPAGIITWLVKKNGTKSQPKDEGGE